MFFEGFEFILCSKFENRKRRHEALSFKTPLPFMGEIIGACERFVNQLFSQFLSFSSLTLWCSHAIMPNHDEQRRSSERDICPCRMGAFLFPFPPPSLERTGWKHRKTTAQERTDTVWNWKDRCASPPGARYRRSSPGRGRGWAASLL